MKYKGVEVKELGRWSSLLADGDYQKNIIYLKKGLNEEQKDKALEHEYQHHVVRNHKHFSWFIEYVNPIILWSSLIGSIFNRSFLLILLASFTITTFEELYVSFKVKQTFNFIFYFSLWSGLISCIRFLMVI